MWLVVDNPGQICWWSLWLRIYDKNKDVHILKWKAGVCFDFNELIIVSGMSFCAWIFFYWWRLKTMIHHWLKPNLYRVIDARFHLYHRSKSDLMQWINSYYTIFCFVDLVKVRCEKKSTESCCDFSDDRTELSNYHMRLLCFHNIWSQFSFHTKNLRWIPDNQRKTVHYLISLKKFKCRTKLWINRFSLFSNSTQFEHNIIMSRSNTHTIE